MAKGGSNRKVANSLLAAGAAAVLTVYAAGYERTRPAAEQLEAESAVRRPLSRPAAPLAAPSAPAVQPQDKRESVREVATVASPSVPAPAPLATPASEPSPEVAPAAPPAAPQPAAQYKDGTYKGWGTCRHGDIEAQVVIEGGRITSASISQCLTRYSCDVIGRLPPEVAQRQSAEVDYVSGATQSANAFYYAVLEALGKAK